MLMHLFSDVPEELILRFTNGFPEDWKKVVKK